MHCAQTVPAPRSRRLAYSRDPQARHRRTILAAAFMMLVILFAGLTPLGSAAQDQPASVRIVAVIPDMPTIDVSLDGARVAERLAYGASSNRLPTVGGNLRLLVTGSSDPAGVLFDAPVEIPSTGASTVVLTGLATGSPSLTPLVLKDDLGLTAQDRIRLRFVHAAPGVAAATLMMGENSVLFEGVGYGGTGDGVFDPGRLLLRAMPAAAGAIAIAEREVVAASGRSYTLILAGQVGGSNPPALIMLDHSRAVQVGASSGGPAGSGTVLVDETFSDPVTGLLPASAPAQSSLIYGYAEGEYYLRNLEVATRSLSVPVDSINATIAVDARLIGDTVQRTVSVGCRFASDSTGNRGYRLRVEPAAGLFRLVREDGARDVLLRRDSRSPAIRPGSEVNRLELTCAGNTITAAINGTVVASVQDSTYGSGAFVFGVGARASGLTSEARFDNLLVTAR